jgi:hypothetical protein
MMNLAEALNKATVIVESKRGPSSTVHTLTGSPDAVEEAVMARLREYPSEAYGTTVRYTKTGAVVSWFNNGD